MAKTPLENHYLPHVHLERRVSEHFKEQEQRIYKDTDRLFAILMPIQFVFGIIIALVFSPRVWSGAESSIHPHVFTAIFLGGLISGPPVILALTRPGQTITRYVIACCQMLTSALLIHLTGGRIETHFHVFGSLALLAIYRDWKVLIPATVIVALDHLVRGTYFPQSVYGIIVASPWRTVEHAAWVIFEDIFLIHSCFMSVREIKAIAQQQAQLEATNSTIEQKVIERTEELKLSLAEKDILHVQLNNAQKLESIGQLSAGVAHEINTPIQFVTDNTHFLKDSFAQICLLLEANKKIMGATQIDQNIDQITNIIQVAESIDIPYLINEIPPAINQSIEGLDRITKIVQAMKEFSHPGTESKIPFNVNKAIESTIQVTKNEWKTIADITTDLDQNLPDVPGYPADMRQVILNMIINASHAIAATQNISKKKGEIRIRTSLHGDSVKIEISDTGSGIPESIRAKIFDPFFTTKEVGKGTGQGLAICHSIVFKKHGGSITFETEVGEGTTFIILLPVAAHAAEIDNSVTSIRGQSCNDNI